MKTKILSLTALKGGTGKTLLTFNVATLLATKYRKKVLVIDMDPQHNMSNLLTNSTSRKVRTSSSNPNMVARSSASSTREYVTEDIFEGELEASRLIRSTHIKGLDIIATTISLTAIEMQISGLAGRESILKNWLYDNEKELKKYDYIFFDSNPTMSIVNINSFVCCDSILLISDIDIDGIEAVSTFLELYYPIQGRIDRRLDDNIKGLIINKVKENSNMAKDFISYVEDEDFIFSDLLLKTKIHDAIALAETKIHKEPISVSRNERSYDELIELIEELKSRGVL